MRKYISRLISIILVVVLVCSLGMVSASAAPYEAHITGSGVNFRKGPGTSYAIKGVYSYGTTVTVIERLENGWCRVSIFGVEGFVYGAYVSRGLTPEAPIAMDLSDQGADGYVNTNNVNLRTGPGSNYASLGALLRGTDVLVLSYLSNGWYGVQVNGYPGFIFGDYVTVGSVYTPSADEFVTGAPYTGPNPIQYCNTPGVVVRSAPSSNASAIGTLPVYVEINILTEYSNGWYGVSYQALNGATLLGYVYSYNLDDSQTILADVVPEYVSYSLDPAYIIADKVAWRTGPGAEFPIAMYFNKGTKVSVTGAYKNAEGLIIWYEVYYNGVGPGCVASNYIASNPADIPNANLPVTSWPVGATGYTNANSTPVYHVSGNGQIIGYLSIGTEVQVVTEFSNGWLLVTIPAGPCYIYKTYVNY